VREADALWVERGAEQIECGKKTYNAEDLDTRVMRSGSTHENSFCRKCFS